MVLPGVRPVCFIERQAYAAAVLVARMGRGELAPAPIWDDVTTFDSGRWRGRVDLIVAGYPCQPESVAGNRRGADDERWLWRDVWRITRDVGARYLFVENVTGHLSGTFEKVLGDVAAGGWIAEWDCVPAAAVGAPHLRDRWFMLASESDANRQRCEAIADGPPAGIRRPPGGDRQASGPGPLADTDGNGLQSERGSGQLDARERPPCGPDVDGLGGAWSGLTDTARAHLRAIVEDGHRWWRWDHAPEPTICGVANGVRAGDDRPDDHADRLHALGNAVVRHAAAYAWVVLADRLSHAGKYPPGKVRP